MFANACMHSEDDVLDASFDLTDNEGNLAAKMKIVLSPISASGSGDNVEEFLKRVEDDVSLMSSPPSSLSTIVQILKLTKAIMDQVSQVVHLSRLNLNRLIVVIRYTRYSMHRGPSFPVFTR